MKKLYTLLFALFAALVFFEPAQVKASHVMGADIQWECLGNGKYAVKVTAYRDCKGILFGSTPIQFKPKAPCGGGIKSASTALSDGAGIDITPVCRKQCTQCPGPNGNPACDFQFGIGMVTLTAVIDLSQEECCEWVISWDQCCRNGEITTGASNQGFYAEVFLNKCIEPCDNSPYFTNPPVAIVCEGQCQVMNPGVNDIDMNNGQADSLVYKFVEPLSAAGQPIPYTGGYSKDMPLKFDGFPNPEQGEFLPPNKCKGFTLDPQTGDLMFRPTAAGDITVLSLGIEEWRKDKDGIPRKIGEVRRDVQIAVIKCPTNKAPIITGINGGPLTGMDFCANQSKCFTVYGFDTDTDDSVSISSNAVQVVPNSSWTVVPDKKFPKGTFCWTPTNAHVRSYPYRFIVTAQDDACPVNGRGSKAFTVKVNASPEATYTAKIGECGEVVFTAFPNFKLTSIADYEWSGSRGGRNVAPNFKVKGNPVTIKYPKPGKYEYTLTLTSTNGCKTTYTDSLIIPDYVWLKLPDDTTVCINSTINLTTKRFLGKGDYLYNWSIDKKVNGVDVWTKDRTTISNLLISKDTVFWVRVRDNFGNGCPNADTIKVRAQVHPKPNLGFDRRECSIAGKFIELDASKGLPKQKSYEWYKVSATNPSQSTLIQKDDKGKILIQDSGIYRVVVTDTIGCVGEDSIKMSFNPLIDVKAQTVNACQGEVFEIKGHTTSNSAKWQWFDLRYPNSGPFHFSPTYTAIANGIANKIVEIPYKVMVTQTLNGLTCTDVDTVYVRVYQKPFVKAPKIPAQCVNASTLNLANLEGAQPNFGDVWWTYDKKINNRIPNNQLSPKVVGVGKTYLYYWHRDAVSGCANFDSSLLVIDTLPNVFAGRDTFICMENGPLLLSQIHNVSPQQGGTWVMLDKDQKGLQPGLNPSFNPAVSGPGKFGLIYIYEDKGPGAKCSNKDTIFLDVYPKLNVIAGKIDPVCSVVESITLGGIPQGVGKWSGDANATPAITYNAALGRYYFSPKTAGPGKYKLWYTAAHPLGRCPQTDTTFITVNPSPDVQLNTPGNVTQFCISEGIVALQATPAGGSFYVPSAPTVMAGTGNNFDPTRSGVGTFVVEYTYQDAVTKCENKTSIEIEITDTPWVQIQPSGPLCRGNSYPMQVSTANAGNFEWKRIDGNGNAAQGNFLPDAFSPNVTYTPTLDEELDGEFTLAVISDNAQTVCDQAESKVRFIISPTPTAEFTLGPDKGCGPLGVTFTNKSHVNEDEDEIVTSIWDFGDGTVDTINEKQFVHYYDYKGVGSGLNKFTVKLTVFSKANCKAEIIKVDTVEVFVTPVPQFSAKPTYTTINAPKIDFTNLSDPSTVDDKTIWEWNFGDPYIADGGKSTDKHATHLYRDTGKYTVSLKATNPSSGCDSTIVKINYIDIRPEIIVFIPNAFTPGGSRNVDIGPAENNSFKAIVSAISSYDLKVYNRWGQLMFHSTEPEIGWNGKFQERDAQMDVYIYVLKVQSLSGKDYKYTGSVTLLR